MCCQTQPTHIHLRWKLNLHLVIKWRHEHLYSNAGGGLLAKLIKVRLFVFHCHSSVISQDCTLNSVGHNIKVNYLWLRAYKCVHTTINKLWIERIHQKISHFCLIQNCTLWYNIQKDVLFWITDGFKII